MSKRCELTGKGVMTGNKVSHAMNHTRRRFLPNLVRVTLMSEALDRQVKLRISANALRTVEQRGGLDAFLLKADTADLSDRAQALKQEVRAGARLLSFRRPAGPVHCFKTAPHGRRFVLRCAFGACSEKVGATFLAEPAKASNTRPDDPAL